MNYVTYSSSDLTLIPNSVTTQQFTFKHAEWNLISFFVVNSTFNKIKNVFAGISGNYQQLIISLITDFTLILVP